MTSFGDILGDFLPGMALLDGTYGQSGKHAQKVINTSKGGYSHQGAYTKSRRSHGAFEE